MLRKALKILTILAGTSVISSCDEGNVQSWTIRGDGIIRRQMTPEECAKYSTPPKDCKIELTVPQFIEMVRIEEKKTFSYVVTPANEQKIAKIINDLRIDLAECKARK